MNDKPQNHSRPVNLTEEQRAKAAGKASEILGVPLRVIVHDDPPAEEPAASDAQAGRTMVVTVEDEAAMQRVIDFLEPYKVAESELAPEYVGKSESPTDGGVYVAYVERDGEVCRELWYGSYPDDYPEDAWPNVISIHQLTEEHRGMSFNQLFELFPKPELAKPAPLPETKLDRMNKKARR